MKKSIIAKSARTVLASLILVAFAPAAYAAIELNAPIKMSQQVKVGKLPNGLTYYIQKNGKPEKKLELRLVVKAGSALEDDSQQGLAHFTEHMAFNGTSNFKKQEMISYLQSIGVKFGADLNAYTSFNETVYILPIPTDKQDNVDKGFLMMKDIAQGVSFNAVDIDEERGILLQENRGSKGAQDRIQRQLFPKLFNGSIYARRLPGGKDDILQNFKHAEIKRFYKDWYRPDLMAVIAVGDIDPVAAEAMIKKHFAGLVNPAKPRPHSYAKIPARVTSDAVAATDKEANGNVVIIDYPAMEVKKLATVADYRARLIETVFAEMLNQRMLELTQQANPPFMYAKTSLSKMPSNQRAYQSLAVLSKGGAVPAINALIQENTRASQFGFSAAELERAKKNIMRATEGAYSERDKTDSAKFVGELVQNFLFQESVPGVEQDFKFVSELLPAITLEELNAYARVTMPKGAPKLVAYVGASNTELAAPSNTELLAAVDAAEKLPVTARVEKAVASSLMSTPPKAGAITEESQDKQLGLTRLTLSNGVKVILKPSDFNNDQVLLTATRFGGESVYDEKDRFNARYASFIASSMGLKDHAPVDLMKILAGKKVGAATGSTLYTDLVNASSGANDIETMLQVVHLKFAGARRDPELFKTFVGNSMEATRNFMAQPNAMFEDMQVAALYNDHPRVARMPRPEDFSKIDLDRTIAIYNERFGSARDMTFVIVGSFDVEKIKPLIATYLASLPSAEIPSKFRDLGADPVRGVVKKEVLAGTEPKSTVSIKFTGPAQYSELEQMRLQGIIDVLNLRITEVLREKMAVIYSGGSRGQIAREPKPSYEIGMTFPTGPANVDKLLQATFAEIARLQADGPTEAEMVKVKQNWLQNHQKSMRTNQYWAGKLQNAALYGTDPATLLSYEKRVADLTAAEVKAAAQRYFDMKNYVQVVLNPAK